MEQCSFTLIKSSTLLTINTLATMPNLQTPDQALKLSRTIGHTEWVRSQRGNLLKKKARFLGTSLRMNGWHLETAYWIHPILWMSVIS